MHTHIYLNILIALILALILFITGKMNQLNKKLAKRLKKNDDAVSDLPTESEWYIYPALTLAIIVIIAAFCAPYLYTDISGLKDTKDTGSMGDTIGGLMNPYIALAGVIITGLAFYMQYEANKQQRTLFLLEQKSNKDELQDQIDRQDGERKLQQFEAQFYEMIRLHRENVSEMEINGYDFEQDAVKNTPMEKFTVDTTGRKIFVTMKTELECILSAYKAQSGKDLDLNHYAICYDIFFSGLDKYINTYGNTDQLAMTLHLARRKHQFPTRFKVYNNHKRKDLVGTVNMNFNYKPFSGHASRLGHYFRHLYLIVKQVVFSEALENDAQRRNYLRILRAQLSNHEQILLFYNWMGEHGENWENDVHNFFTRYNMIHNLWYNELIDDLFIQSQVNLLRIKAEALGNMDIFEID